MSEQGAIDRLFGEACALTDEDRIELAERLIESLQPDVDILQDQVALAAHRADELESGVVRGIPGPEALNSVRTTLLRAREGLR